MGNSEERVAILIVDDQEDGLLSARTVLEPLGEEIVLARSGREALRCLLNRDFAVVLLDVQMPVMDGFEAATLIRERERSRATPIIFMTAGMHSEQAVFRGYEVGAVDYVFKPVVAHVLCSKVRVFLELARKDAALRRRTLELDAANQRLSAQNRDLEALNRELEAFSSTVSHDLRAPLRHISGFSRLLAEHLGDSLDVEARRYLDTIVMSVTHMGTLIDDLLAFARLGRHRLNLVRVDVGALVEETRRELMSQVAGREVEWRIGSLPEVPGDTALLRVAFTNLLGNALKFTARREKAVIEVGAERRGTEDVVVHVRDNGAGFDHRQAGRLFGVFQRLHSQEEFEGTGIGLAIVRRIVERHGGMVWAEGAPGEGAAFMVRLPATLPEERKVVLEESGARAGATP